MFARVSASAVAKVKATAVVAATIGAGSVGGVVALHHVAPAAQHGGPAKHIHAVPLHPGATTPADDPGMSHRDQRQSSAQPNRRSHPVPTATAAAAGRQKPVAAPVSPTAAPHPHPGDTHPAPSHSAPTHPSRTDPSHAAVPPAATPTPAPTPEPSCADHHGSEVSQTAQNTETGKGHGEPVETTAHSDCGKS